MLQTAPAWRRAAQPAAGLQKLAVLGPLLPVQSAAEVSKHFMQMWASVGRLCLLIHPRFTC